MTSVLIVYAPHPVYNEMTQSYKLGPAGSILNCPCSCSEQSKVHVNIHIFTPPPTVNVSVSDGRFTSYAPVTVTVTLVTREMRDNAVVIQFQNVLPDEFVIFHYQNFLRALRTEMQVGCNLQGS